MRDRRGALGRTLGAAADIVGAVRARQVGSEPRVVVYDAAGHSRRLRPGSEDHDALIELAERLVAAAREAPSEGGEAAPEAP